MRERRTIGVIATVLFAAAVMFSGRESIKAAEEERILDGIYIGNVDVGGMNAGEARQAVEAYIDSLRSVSVTLKGADGSVELTAADMGLTAEVDAPVQKALKIGRAGSLINRYKVSEDLKRDHLVYELRMSMDKQKTAQKLYEHSGELGIEAVDYSLVRENGAFRVIPGSEGVEIDIVQSVWAISDLLTKDWNGTDREIELVSNVIQPRGGGGELEQVKDLLGSFSTNYSSSSANRAKNVATGVSKVNGTLLFPGDEFLFRLTVSPFTQANGYELAGSYENGTTVESFGGGICQVSTTLYNAAIRAELEITMRSNHSMQVAYVQPSMDAAIAGDYKDLHFVNNYDIPVYIEGYCSGGNLYFNIYGKETRAANREVVYESETLSTDTPETQYQLDSTLAAGYWRVVQSAHIGCKAQLWKVVKVDGEVQSRNVFNKSTYRSSPKIIKIGTKNLTAEQLAALNAAIASKVEADVRSVVQSFKTPDPGTEEQPGTTTPGSGEGSDQQPGTTAPGEGENQQPGSGEGSDQQPGEGAEQPPQDPDYDDDVNSDNYRDDSDDEGSYNTDYDDLDYTE